MMKHTILALASFCWLLSTPAILAQSFTASMRGVVADPTEATIPSAKVTATDVHRNLTYSSITDDSGRYVITSLQPGTYTLSAEAQGFQKYSSSTFVLQVQQQATIDIPMLVGTAETTVQVTDTQPRLNQTSAALGQVVDNAYVRSIPLIDRAVMRLVSLTPGLVPSNLDPGASNQGFSTAFVSNGVRTMTSDVYVDGAPVTGVGDGYGGAFLHTQPNVESVQEFKVQTNFFSAEFGNTGGTVVNAVSKSGTNELHGSAYEFFRNNNFNANSFFAKRSGNASLPEFSQHKFGFAVGGPFSIPKLYKGKNRTFFHTTFNVDRDNNAAERTGTVPTALERTGNFSETRDQNGRLMVVYNPFDTYRSADGSVLRRPFPNNTIPASMQSPIARRVMEYYAQPTSEGSPFTHANNFFAQGTAGGRVYRANGKIDHTISDKQRIYGRYAREAFRQRPFLPWGPPAEPFTTGRFHADAHNFVFDYTRTHNATTVLSARYGVVRQVVNHLPHNLGFDPTSLGLPQILLTSGIPLFPRFQPEGYTAVGTAANSQSRRIDDAQTFIYDVTKIAGAHSVKAGGELRVYRLNFRFLNTPSGSFNFGRITTSENPLLSGPTQGNGLASFLLGWGDVGGYSLDQQPASASRYYGWYVQDDWKISHNLTLNLGFRYDFELPRTERYDRYSWFDFDVASPINGRVPGYNLRGGLQFTDENTPSPFNKDMNNVQPRVGFAYALNNRTTIRGGYGIYYSFTTTTANRALGAPFSTNTPVEWSRDGGFTPYASLGNPFPDGLIVPSGKAAGAATFLGQSLSTASRPNRTPQYQQWAFSIQHALPANSVVEVNYTGTRGTHLYFPDLENANRLNPVYWSLGRTELNRQVANPFFGVITAPTSPLSRPTLAQSTLLRPYPQYTGLSVSTPTIGNSIYHSAQFKFEKRFSHGLTAIANYTWAKLIDDASNNSNGFDFLGGSSAVQNVWNLTQERSLSVFDVAHRAVISFAYELPFGRGRPMGNRWHRVLDILAGGWDVNGILTFQGGYPIVIGLQSPNLLEGGQRPNLIGDPAVPGSVRDRLNNYFNLTAFSRPAIDTYGSAPRTLNYRTPGISNADLVLAKRFRVREKDAVQFRVEAFNALNGVVFGAPNATFGATIFGQIIGYAGGFSARQIQFAVRYDF